MKNTGRLAGPVLLALLFLTLLVPCADAQESGSVTRGRAFTVTVIGNLRTPYVVWVSGTSAMTGEPGDQPPIVAPGQTDVTQDPPGGPYVIGSTPISGGRTVLEDVAPSTPAVPATSYYAQVRTGIDGRGIVAFLTSRDTATQQFHVAAVNPANPDEEVTVILGVPEPVILPTTQGTPRPTVSLPPATSVTVPQDQIRVISTTVPETPVQSATPKSPGIPETVSPSPTPQEIPVTALTGGLAVGLVLVVTAWFHRRQG